MSLVLGPVLRHVGDTTAAVWVQLDRPATVSVLGCSARTFEVALRFKRYYKPYTIFLKNFSFDRYAFGSGGQTPYVHESIV